MRNKKYGEAEEYARSALAFPGGSQVIGLTHSQPTITSAHPQRPQASASLSLAVALAATDKIQAAHEAFSSAASESRHTTEV